MDRRSAYTRYSARWDVHCSCHSKQGTHSHLGRIIGKCGHTPGERSRCRHNMSQLSEPSVYILFRGVHIAPVLEGPGMCEATPLGSWPRLTPTASSSSVQPGGEDRGQVLGVWRQCSASRRRSTSGHAEETDRKALCIQPGPGKARALHRRL